MKPVAVLLLFIVALTSLTSCLSECMISFESWPAVCATAVDAQGQQVTPDWVRYRVGAGHEIDVVHDEWADGDQWCFGDDEVGVYSIRAGWKGMVAGAELEVEGDVGCSEGVSVELQFLPEPP